MSEAVVIDSVTPTVELLAPWVVEDIRPLIAFLVPWLGMIGIMWAGEKRPNLRETFTLVAAVIQSTVVLSMVPVILNGAIIECHVWQIFTHVPLLLRVDGPGILFACVASLFSPPPSML